MAVQVVNGASVGGADVAIYPVGLYSLRTVFAGVIELR